MLAAAGLGSRREIEEWISAGRVRIGGRVAQLGDRASAGDAITVDGQPVARAEGIRPRVLLYHKPVGEIVSRRDPGGRRSVFESLPALRTGRWIAVGRLDLNTSGLLLVTDSGDLANRLMHPRYGLEREYRARVLGRLDAALRQRLLAGVELEGEVARFERIDEEDPDRTESANRWYRVVLREGRNREVRRLIEAVGLRVSRLARIRFGSVRLPHGLAPGAWRELGAAELASLSAAAAPTSA